MRFEFIYELTIGISILYSIILFLFYFKKLTTKRDIEKKKQESMNFCFNDKFDYEKFVTEDERHRFFSEDKQALKILSNFDKISIALKHNILDEPVIFDYYNKYFIHFYNEYQYFIIERRQKSENPDLFLEFEKLARRWENELHNFKNIK